MLWTKKQALSAYSPAAFASILNNSLVLAWLVQEGVDSSAFEVSLSNPSEVSEIDEGSTIYEKGGKSTNVYATNEAEKPGCRRGLFMRSVIDEVGHGLPGLAPWRSMSMTWAVLASMAGVAAVYLRNINMA